MSEMRFTKTHEWVRLDGPVVKVGITDFATSQLSDVTYVSLPKVGERLSVGRPFGEVETVKAVSDVYSPVGGVVEDVNDLGDYSKLTADPFGEGWMVAVRLDDDFTPDHLLTEEQYREQVEGHG